MSTFFEKLTGAASSSPQVVSSPQQSQPSQQKSIPEPKKTAVLASITAQVVKPEKPERSATHLKVEADSPAPLAEKEDAGGEEGELTVDIYDRGDTIVIQSTVAGVKPEDLDVTITSDSVSIRGKRERAEAVEEKNYYYKELFWGTFSRSIILPEEIEEDLSEATIKNGLLTVRLPKKRKGVVQKLKVKVS